MDYQEIVLHFNDEKFPEILEAELAEIGFDSFVSEGRSLKGYIPQSQFSQASLSKILEAYKDDVVSTEQNRIEHQNWNELWESNYDPVTVDDKIFIGAPFHEAPAGFENKIILEPNMSFGTGHHPTTHMMLRSLSTMDLVGKSVFDYGAGSGILSIYADQRGAEGVGIEIDSHAAKTANENLALNDCQSFRIIPGTLEQVQDSKFDVIVANINRNVIEESASQLRELATDEGTLLCAGFFSTDVPSLTKVLIENDFEYVDQLNEGDWTLLKFIAS